MSKKRIVIIGGHQSPAIAVIEKLLEKGDWKIFFIGRKYAFLQAKDVESFEYQTIAELDIPFLDIEAPRFPHSITSAIVYPLQLLNSFLKARAYLKKTKPSVVMGFGGYLSVPVILAASFASIPIVLHEQAFEPGRATKLLSRFAQKVFVSWRVTKKHFSAAVQSKIELVGNPVRESILESSVIANSVDSDIKRFISASSKPLVYVTGGSTGAHPINNVVGDGIGTLLRHFTIIHQCGDSQYHDFETLTDQVEALPEGLSKKYLLKKYMSEQDVSHIMKHADIILGRAGVNTLVELAVLAKPVVFVPHPGVPGGEQYVNAQYLQSKGSAEIIDQADFTTARLINTIQNIQKNYKKYYANSSKIQKTEEIAIHTNAAERISCFIEHLASNASSDTSQQ